jgi:reductive dehalogenase
MDDYGRPIHLDHPFAIVFLVEMDHGEMQRAPRAEALRESARQYHRAAGISAALEAVLRSLGARARAHYDAHYDVMLPPLAVEAGLGELGRHNILIADRFGSRVRIGAVTTDFPLRPGQPAWLGADRFCAICRKCADACPSRALAGGDKQRVRGVDKWPTLAERCYAYWRTAGSDCGICMEICPFSHPDTPLHNLVRWFVRRASWVNRAALACDDLVYGRRWPRGGRGASRSSPVV